MSFNFRKYSALVGQMESGDINVPNSFNYEAQNSIGALGKYQFMPTTLNGLKDNFNLPDWKNANYFLSNPQLQETYFFNFVNENLAYIKTENLDRFLGKQIQGSKRFPFMVAKLNLYGMLAAAHLSGVGNLKRFLLDGYNPDDGNTSLSDYAVYFSSKIQDNDFFFSIALAFIPAIALYYYK
jgi:hypothetical protein